MYYLYTSDCPKHKGNFKSSYIVSYIFILYTFQWKIPSVNISLHSCLSGWGQFQDFFLKIERVSEENILSPDNKSTLVMEYFKFENGWNNEIMAKSRAGMV